MRKYYFGVIDPNYSAEYSIGGLKITVYHYFNKEGETTKKTPFKKNIINVNKFEGIYHPSVKIDGYPLVTIDEFGVKDLTNSLRVIPEDEIRCNKDYLIGLIVLLLHALKFRLLSNINLRIKGVLLDPGHLIAYRFTGKNVTKYVCMLKKLIKPTEYSQISDSLVPHFIFKEDIHRIYSTINGMSVEILENEYSMLTQNKENNPIKKKLF